MDTSSLGLYQGGAFGVLGVERCEPILELPLVDADVEIRNILGGDLKIALDGGQTLLGLLRERGAAAKSWLLALGQDVSERSLSGILKKGGVRIVIRGQHQLAQTSLGSFEAAGFMLSLQGGPVAAVETINRGAVWIHPGVTPEMSGVLAAAASALLLYQDLLALDLTRDGN